MQRIIFKGIEPYEALVKAQKYLISKEYSFGVEDGKNPIGIKKGNCIVKRWSYMSAKEKETLDGILESKNFRGNRIKLIIFSIFA